MNYLEKKKKAMLNYVSGSTPPIPSEYQQVEWIGSSGMQAINLITEQSNADYEYIAEIEVTSLGNYNAIITERRGGNGSGIRINSSSKKFRLGYKTGNWTDVGNATSLNTKYKIAFDKYGLSVDDVFISAIPTGSTSATLTFLDIRNDSSYNGLSGKTYYVQVKENGQLVRNLIPCYRKADNVIGFYDTVNDDFYTNIGSGTFTKGNDV